MPKTTIDENRNLRWPEDDVSSTTQSFDRRFVYSESQALTVKGRPNGSLWWGISLPDCLHSRSCLKGRCLGCWWELHERASRTRMAMASASLGGTAFPIWAWIDMLPPAKR